MTMAALFLATGVRTRITGIDWVVIAIYFGILLGVAWYVVRRGKDSAADYFLAGRNLSFWIGSVLVIFLTGLYTALGGMRAVAYNDVVQTVVLIIGSASLTGYGLIKLGGWGELRRWCGSEMFNLWKPLIPAGVESTWAP